MGYRVDVLEKSRTRGFVEHLQSGALRSGGVDGSRIIACRRRVVPLLKNTLPPSSAVVLLTLAWAFYKKKNNKTKTQITKKKKKKTTKQTHTLTGYGAISLIIPPGVLLLAGML